MELNLLTTFVKHDVNYNVRQCFKTKKSFGKFIDRFYFKNILNVIKINKNIIVNIV